MGACLDFRSRLDLVVVQSRKQLFLPAYSPDLNPIEQVFAKLKMLLRKLDTRTIETTWRGIGQFLDAFTPQECQLLQKLWLCFSMKESCSSFIVRLEMAARRSNPVPGTNP